MNIAIVKYNAGNIYSVDYALKRLGVEAVITSDKELLQKADKVIFPGVGEAETTMNYLREQQLDKLIKDLKQPVLGICLGMQLMCRHSEEGNADCLGIFDIDVKKFQPTRHEDKVPHMGWNTLTDTNSALFKGFDKEEFVYFVHSFYVPLNEFTAATTGQISVTALPQFLPIGTMKTMPAATVSTPMTVSATALTTATPILIWKWGLICLQREKKPICWAKRITNLLNSATECLQKSPPLPSKSSLIKSFQMLPQAT